MSISLSWQLVKPVKRQDLPGTSHDWAVFNEVFGTRSLSSADIPVLAAMHLANRGLVERQSFWGTLADALRDLPEGSKIQVTAEW